MILVLTYFVCFSLILML